MLTSQFLVEQAIVVRQLANQCLWTDLRRDLEAVAAQFEKRACELERNMVSPKFTLDR